MKRIDPDLLPQDQRRLDFLLLDALDTQTGERAGHRVGVYFDGANALLAALLAHQVVWVRPVWGVNSDARHDDDCATLVPDDLKNLVLSQFAYPFVAWHLRFHKRLIAKFFVILETK